MIGLNKLIHDLTQALPNMKLKKVMPGPRAGVYIYYFHYVSGLKFFHDWIKQAHS